MARPRLTISKTAYMSALKSRSRGAFQKAASNDNGTGNKNDLSAQMHRESGTKIGELAHDYFPEGIEIPEDYRNTFGAESSTRDLIAAGETVLFEAAAIHPDSGAFCRLDVLRKVAGSKNEWDMIEVKSSTKAKPEHIDDAAFQRYVFEGAGYKIRNSYIMCLDNTYKMGAKLDPQEFFQLDDVTKRVLTKGRYVEPALREIIAHKNNVQIVEKEGLTKFLDDIEYPIYFLDYEAVMDGVPLYEGTSPYQQVPFQFSLHVQQEPNGPLNHISFLHKERSDPRRDFAEKLVEACGDKGSVVVFYAPYESGRNKELATDFPDLAKGLRAINKRMVDIYEPFKQRLLYDPRQNGSASLKVVLPTYTDISYDGMAISNGEQALNEYKAFAKGMITDPQELDDLWRGLDEYCEQDTYAMVKLLDVLYDKADYEPELRYAMQIAPLEVK